MLIRPAELAKIRDGAIDLAFRRWDRPRLLVGTRMRTKIGLVEVTSVDRVAGSRITAADARRAGAASRADLLAALSGRDGPIFRVGLRFAGDDPRVALRNDAALTDAVAASLSARLDRLDAASTRGPWTRDTLRSIAANPAVRAPDLAVGFGLETVVFKRDVRKLKELGLTESLDVGYRISPRGAALLQHESDRFVRWAGKAERASVALHSCPSHDTSSKCAGVNVVDMATATLTSCVRTLPVGDPGTPQRTEMDELIELSRRPWTMLIGRTPMIVRPSTVRDLPAVAQMHRRCSARSLLDRYRQGGRSPAIATLDSELRNPHALVAFTADGSVVATASLRRDPTHGHLCAETSVLVEDAWQRRGIGSELLSHLAGVAQVAGYNELIAYPATAVPAAQGLMVEVGRTRMVPGSDAHLHTYLPEAATLGLGSVRQRLAG